MKEKSTLKDVANNYLTHTIVDDLADIQYLFFASNINFIQRIKKQFDEFFKEVQMY